MLTAFARQNDRLRPTTGPLRAALWIDLVEPPMDEVARVVTETGIALPTEHDINEIENSSRLAARDGVLYLSLPVISQPETEPRAISVGFVLSPDRFITQRFAPSRLFDRFIATLPDDRGAAHGSAHVFVALLEAIVDRQADALEAVRSELETISHRIFCGDMVSASGRRREDAMLRATLVTLGRLGDLISHIRDSQVTAGRIVPFVEAAAGDWLQHELRPRLHTLRDDIASLNDFDTHLNDKLQFLLDATLGFINIAQNNVMKVLTVASVVGIPPVLIAGIYGMNFKSMPEYDWSWGYPYGLGVIALTAIITLGLFKWRNWI